MTTATAQGPWTEDEIRARVQEARVEIDNELGAAICAAVTVVNWLPDGDDPQWERLWDDMNEIQEKRLAALIEQVYDDLTEELVPQIIERTVKAAMRFIRAYPDLPRARALAAAS